MEQRQHIAEQVVFHQKKEIYKLMSAKEIKSEQKNEQS